MFRRSVLGKIKYHEKTCLRAFRPGCTATEDDHMLEISYLGMREKQRHRSALCLFLYMYMQLAGIFVTRLSLRPQ